jgi:hypothetical protein
MTPYAGDGTFERTPGTLIPNQGPLVSAQINDETNNLVDGMDGKVNLDGKLPMTAAQTIVAGTTLTHAATRGEAQANVLGHSSAVAGTVDAIQVTMSPAITTWATNELISWKSGGANTVTAPTISKDAGGSTKIIKKGASAALVAGDTGASGYECFGRYNGTDLILLNPASSVSLASTTEVLTGTDAGKAVTPDALAAFWEKGSNIASAATITIGEGGIHHVTGTTGISNIRLCRFRDRPISRLRLTI